MRVPHRAPAVALALVCLVAIVWIQIGHGPLTSRGGAGLQAARGGEAESHDLEPLPPWAPVVRGGAAPPGPSAQRGPQASDEVAIEVRIVSALTRSPIPGAAIELLGLPGASRRQTGDDAGRARLVVPAPAGERGLVVIVQATDYCRRMLPLYARDDTTVVGLAPAGSLRLELVDEAGEPAPGVVVSLLPPGEGGRPWTKVWRGFSADALGPGPDWMRTLCRSAVARGRVATAEDLRMPASAPEIPALIFAGIRDREFTESVRDCIDPDAWTTATDAEGVATWTGIPARPGYQWGAPAGPIIRYDPAPIPPLRPPGGSVRISTEDPARDLSGPFTVRAAGETRLQGVVAVETGVFGTVLGARPRPPQRVVAKLFHLASHETAAAQGYEALGIEASAWAASDGRFAFKPVQPGHKYLKVWWREEGEQGEDVFFGGTDFTLSPGEYKDLGPIEARSGSAVEVDITLVDMAGAVLDPDDHVSRLDEGECYLTALHWPTDGTRNLAPGEHFNVRLGAVTTLHGMPPGRYKFSLGWNDGFYGPEGTRLILPDEHEVHIDGPARVPLQVRLEAVVVPTIGVRFPSGAASTRAEAHLVQAGTGERFRVDLKAVRGADGVARGMLGLPAGTYRLLVHNQTFEEPDTTDSWYAVRERLVVDGSPVEIELGPAASVEGIALDAAGSPLSGKSLLFSAAPHTQRKRSYWTHKVKTGDRGGFRLHGLEPGTEYRSYRGLQFESGPAGSTRSLGECRGSK